MQKRIGFLTLILSLPLLGGCGHQHTFSTEWNYDATKHWHDATCEHKELKDSEANHIDVDGDYVCDVCHYNLPKPVKSDWDDEEKKVFINHLYGFVLPYTLDATVEYIPETDCVRVSKTPMDDEEFEKYVNSMVNLGFSKQDGPYEDTYILLKEVDYEGKTRTIDCDIYLDDSTMYAVCYDPYIYSWPGETVEKLFSYYYVKPDVKVPGIEADRYYTDERYMESYGELTIYCGSKTNLEEQYKSALINNGFSILSDRDDNGNLVAVEPKRAAKVLFKYSDEKKELGIGICPDDSGWPTTIVDYYTDQLTGGSGTRVPAVKGADSYEFIESSYDRWGYFFVLCSTDNNFEEQYAKDLDKNYTVYNEKTNTAGNYFAVSDKNDLFVQYKFIVVESIMGGEDYKHFDVLFEKYYPHNEERINAGLQLINEGTTTTIPAYPGYGEKITFSDTNVYMTITIQGATFDSVKEYIDILDKENWAIKNVEPQVFMYEAISPDRDIKLKTEMVEGRVTLTLTAYEDPYAEWPIEGVNQILKSLGLKGEIPPFEGAYGFDFENDDYHDVICFVKPGKEAELIDAYNQKLIANGWKAKKQYDNIVYVKEGYTICLFTYTEYKGEGRVFIDISYGDGNVFDIDGRYMFSEWKAANGIETDIQIPGIDVTEEVIDIDLYGDEGVSYPGYDLFGLLVDIGEGDKNLTISEIIAKFVSDGWVYSSEDNYYHKEDLFMTSYIYKNYVSIDVCAPIPKKDLLTVMKKFIHDLGEVYEELIKLPEQINIANEYYLTIDSYNLKVIDLSVYLDFTKSSMASNAKAAVLDAFKGVGWTETQTGNTTILKDPTSSLQLELTWAKNDKYILVQFKQYSGY